MKYAILGATGFLGRHLVKKYNKNHEVVCLGRNETKAVELKKRYPRTTWMIGDINDDKLKFLLKDVDIVINCVAIKHIPVAEDNPSLAIDTNIIGFSNVAKASIYNKVKKVITISTDKAYQSTTTYGMTKYLTEELSKQYNRLQEDTKFYFVRYGNVIGSTGSIFEVWKREAEQGKKLKLTDPKMNRFFWSVDDAMKAIKEALKEEKMFYIPKMKAMNMLEACKIYCETYGVKYTIIGNRGNEKLNEGMEEGNNTETADYFTKEEFKQLLQKCGYIK